LELSDEDELSKKMKLPHSKLLIPAEPGLAIADGLNTFINLLLDKKQKEAAGN
jgi:hypothetical protein